jgi:hypothetical protein
MEDVRRTSTRCRLKGAHSITPCELQVGLDVASTLQNTALVSIPIRLFSACYLSVVVMLRED